jgi:hypothetical protein
VAQPLLESIVDLTIRRCGIGSPQVLPHQGKPDLEQIERRLKRCASS